MIFNLNRNNTTKIAGSLYLLAIIVGILSIAYAVDDPEYLIKASSNAASIMIAAFFHFLMAPIYLGIAILLYPELKKSNQWLALGFVAFRIIAAVFIMLGVVILLMLLALSQDFVSAATPDFAYYQSMGNLLQVARDLTNHVATILALSFSGLFLYTLLIKTRWVPRWLSIWGLIGTLLTIIASFLIMFRMVNVIEVSYILLNVPLALHEIILGLWLIFKGFKQAA